MEMDLSARSRVAMAKEQSSGDTPAGARTTAELTAEIVAAYFQNNAIAPADVPKFIRDVASALHHTDGPREPAQPEPAPKPAVPVRRSVSADFIVCLEDGKKFKSLKRHLRTQYNMTPEQYRERWGLAADYPMVAPNYAKERSALAKKMGLGKRARSG
jgi:predicted transcriptional regulator